MLKRIKSQSHGGTPETLPGGGNRKGLEGPRVFPETPHRIGAQRSFTPGEEKEGTLSETPPPHPGAVIPAGQNGEVPGFNPGLPCPPLPCRLSWAVFSGVSQDYGNLRGPE